MKIRLYKDVVNRLYEDCLILLSDGGIGRFIGYETCKYQDDPEFKGDTTCSKCLGEIVYHRKGKVITECIVHTVEGEMCSIIDIYNEFIEKEEMEI